MDYARVEELAKKLNGGTVPSRNSDEWRKAEEEIARQERQSAAVRKERQRLGAPVPPDLKSLLADIEPPSRSADALAANEGHQSGPVAETAVVDELAAQAAKIRATGKSGPELGA